MSFVVANHGLLPEGPRPESLGPETGRVCVRVASGTSSPHSPLCGSDASRFHSRHSRTVFDLP